MRLHRTLVAAAATVVVATLALTVGIAGPASAASAPVPTTNISCAKLASASNPTSAFATPITPQNPAVTEGESRVLGGGEMMPSAQFIRAGGGLVCEWSNGTPYLPWTSGSWVGVRIEFLQNAAADFARWDALGGPSGTEQWLCFGGTCQYMSLRGDDWLYATFTGMVSEASARTVGLRMRDALQLGTESPYLPPRPLLPIGTTCSGIVPLSGFATAIGATTTISYLPDPPGWTPWHAALRRTPSVLCSVSNPAGTMSVGLMQAIPNGRWAFEEVRPFLNEPGRLTPFTPAALRPGDQAFTRCNAVRSDCILDLLIADHWVQVELGPTTLVRTDRMVALSQLVARITAEITTP